jgi:hypothetical protein
MDGSVRHRAQNGASLMCVFHLPVGQDAVPPVTRKAKPLFSVKLWRQSSQMSGGTKL